MLSWTKTMAGLRDLAIRILISGEDQTGPAVTLVRETSDTIEDARISARHIVITDVNDYRLDLAKKMGATVAVNVAKDGDLKKVQKHLGMSEGFDVGLEMSGNAAAFSGMVDNMAHGGKIALLGLPSTSIEFDWAQVIRSMLTIRGGASLAPVFWA